MPRKMSFMLRIMRPGSSGTPTIVCVLPLPVAPYAKTVAFRPRSTPGINPCARAESCDPPAFVWKCHKDHGLPSILP